MASVPGSHYDIFAANQTVNIGLTSDPSAVPTAVPGAFNIELILGDIVGYNSGGSFATVSSAGVGSTTAPLGYQAVAMLSMKGQKLAVLHGDYGIVDTGGSDVVTLGDGNESVVGAPFDTLSGGGGASQLIDGHLGNQLLMGGSGGNETIWGGAGDTIQGSTGANITIAGVAGDTIIGGVAGDEFIDGTQGAQLIQGGSGLNETILSGVADTVRGGATGNETVVGTPGDTITGSGANMFIDARTGNQWIAPGNGNSTIWGGPGDSMQGAVGNGTATIDLGADNAGRRTLWDDGKTPSGYDTVFNFEINRDAVSISAGENLSTVQASAHSVDGGIQFSLPDGSTITLIGVTDFHNILFTTH